MLLGMYHYTKTFWAEVIKLMGNHGIETEPLSNKDLFGMTDCKEDLFANHILLIAKIYIFIPANVITPNQPLWY